MRHLRLSHPSAHCIQWHRRQQFLIGNGRTVIKMNRLLICVDMNHLFLVRLAPLRKQPGDLLPDGSRTTLQRKSKDGIWTPTYSGLVAQNIFNNLLGVYLRNSLAKPFTPARMKYTQWITSRYINLIDLKMYCIRWVGMAQTLKL